MPPREASPMMLVEMMVMIIKAIMMFLMIREMMRLMVLKIIAILPSSTFVSLVSFNSRPPNMEINLN